MDVEEFAKLVLEQLGFEPTGQQISLVAALARYCSAFTPADTVFLLNGYAGTGKTSVMGALVRALGIVGIPSVLLASTGRAAKVLGNFTGRPAYTIHRKIYRAPTVSGGDYSFGAVAENPHVNTVFIVDEASMIGGSAYEDRGVLSDLVQYVFTGVNCKLILLGDTAQLPPVGLAESPAMNPDAFKSMGLNVTRAVITATVRQKRRSGILYNATLLRRNMQQSPLPEPEFRLTGFKDVVSVMPEDLEDALVSSFANYGEGNTILITRSNRRAVDFNLAIRRIIYDRDEILVKGERLLIAQNNYFWTRKSRLAKLSETDKNAPPPAMLDFVANGESAVVEEIYSFEERGGMQFANVCLFFPDHEARLDVKLNLEALTSEAPALGKDKMQQVGRLALYDAALNENTASPTAIRKALKESEYYNALQVKYAYAVTCHKAQGGQWASVFIDLGYIPEDAYGTTEFYRWLYTATTRATERLSLINPALKTV